MFTVNNDFEWKNSQQRSLNILKMHYINSTVYSTIYPGLLFSIFIYPTVFHYYLKLLYSCTQLFQATATVAISWWASSFLREDTEDKSSQMEQEVSQHDNFINFNTKCRFLSCNLVLQDYHKLFLGFRRIRNFF